MVKLLMMRHHTLMAFAHLVMTDGKNLINQNTCKIGANLEKFMNILSIFVRK